MPSTVVLSAYFIIELETCLAIQPWVNREYRKGLSMHPCGALVLMIRGSASWILLEVKTGRVIACFYSCVPSVISHLVLYELILPVTLKRFLHGVTLTLTLLLTLDL
jgi:hypothetical protein